MQAIVFKRSIRPGDAIEDPTLVMFSDGSHESFGTCPIARWRLSNGKYESHLIAVKHTKNAPIKKIFVVRLELGGAVLGTQGPVTKLKNLSDVH